MDPIAFAVRRLMTKSNFVAKDRRLGGYSRQGVLRAGLLKLGTKASRKRMHWTTVGVVGRVGDVLVVEGDARG